MHIEIRDLQNSETFRIDENGTTLGRDKARATIAVPDGGVSGLHARISFKDDKWWIEDLKSSNGTFIDDEKLKPNTPTQLARGTQFKFHQYKYEVIDIEPDGEGQKTAIFNQATQVAHKVEATVENNTLEDDDASSAPLPNAFAAAKSAPAKSEKVAVVKSGTGKASAVSTAAREESSGDAGGQAGSFGDEIKRAIAYYVGAIPAFVFNFKGAVQSAIDNQPRPAMEKMTLAAWAVPANVLGAAIAQIVALLLTIVAGAFAPVSWVIGAVIALAIAVVVSIIAGFIFHPVMKWLVNILKGRSDEKSRTNYFVNVMTATGLMQVIGGVGSLFTLAYRVPYVGPFLGIVPIVLSAFTTFISLYVAYKWFEHFGVVNWFLTALKVLGVLALIGILFGAVGVIRAGVAGLSGGGTVSVGGVAVDVEAAKKLAEEAKADAEKAMAEAKNGKQGATDEKPTDKEDAPSAKADAKSAKEEARAAKEDAKAAAAAAKEAKTAAREDYETYAKKREAIEKAIEKNPTLLTRTEGVLTLYKAMHKDIKAVNEKYKKSKGDPVAERLKEAETYDRTVDAVSELHKKLIEK